MEHKRCPTNETERNKGESRAEIRAGQCQHLLGIISVPCIVFVAGARRFNGAQCMSQPTVHSTQRSMT